MSDALLEAISFAARVHRHQQRKDKETPYVGHVFRVAMIARHVLGVDDPKVLTAAVLHDTIEDTTTDFDELAEQFGDEVATWVAALTKNTTLPDAEREADYTRRLAAGGWQVCVCKLADIYDNVTDCRKLTIAQQQKALARSKMYLDALRPTLTPESRTAFAVVEKRVADLEKHLASA
jgi:guanosine-3',5'-bis(diphosphate) 3'-pyrophosphohydrolase